MFVFWHSANTYSMPKRSRSVENMPPVVLVLLCSLGDHLAVARMRRRESPRGMGTTHVSGGIMLCSCTKMWISGWNYAKVRGKYWRTKDFYRWRYRSYTEPVQNVLANG
jgi:hypothetical protein